MIGNLEPEEHVMDESNSWINDLHQALTKLQWQHGDTISVEIGGTSVSGIYQGEDTTKNGLLNLECVNITKMRSS